MNETDAGAFPSNMEDAMTTHEQTKAEVRAEAKAEAAEIAAAKKAKPTPEQMGAALHAALKGMVAEAEKAGQRDLPHVCAARAALEMTEPKED